MKFHARGYQQNLYGPAHLWSLEYLAIMLLAFSIFVWLRRSHGAAAEASGVAAGMVGPRVGLALEAAAAGHAHHAHPLGRTPPRRTRRDDGPDQHLRT